METGKRLLVGWLSLIGMPALAETVTHPHAQPEAAGLEAAAKQGNIDAKEAYARQRFAQEPHLGFGALAFAALLLPAEAFPGKVRLAASGHDPHHSKRDRFFVGMSGLRFSRQQWQGLDATAFGEMQDSRWTFPSVWAAQAYLVQRLPLPDSGLSQLGPPVSPDHVLNQPNSHGYVRKGSGAKATGQEWLFLTQHDNVVAELVLKAPAAAHGQKAAHGLAEASTVFATLRQRLLQPAPR